MHCGLTVFNLNEPIISSLFVDRSRSQETAFMLKSVNCVFRDRLSASDMLHVRKVIEHVYEKVIGNDNSNNSGNQADKEQAGPPTEQQLEELGALAESRVELLCHEQVGW